MKLSLFVLISIVAHAGAPLPGDSLFHLRTKWTSQTSQVEAMDSLRGKVVVLAMIYTNCKTACPMTVSAMQDIERRVPAEALSRTQFALFSLDDARDNVKQLNEFATARKLSSHWTLFAGTKAGVRELAVSLGVQYKKLENGEFSHSTAIFILDQNGVIRHRLEGPTPEPQETAGQILKLLSK